jgi:hypothetical protein
VQGLVAPAREASRFQDRLSVSSAWAWTTAMTSGRATKIAA